MWEGGNVTTRLIIEVETLPSGFEVEEETTTNTTTITGTVGVDLQQQRRGKQHTVNEQIDTESLGDRIVSREVIQFMRSRNIEFTSTRLKSLFTQVYPFFDNVDVTRFCISKLVEIEMVSGTFQASEGVVGGIMSHLEDTEDDTPSTTAQSLTVLLTH